MLSCELSNNVSNFDCDEFVLEIEKSHETLNKLKAEFQQVDIKFNDFDFNKSMIEALLKQEEDHLAPYANLFSKQVGNLIKRYQTSETACELVLNQFAGFKKHFVCLEEHLQSAKLESIETKKLYEDKAVTITKLCEDKDATIAKLNEQVTQLTAENSTLQSKINSTATKRDRQVLDLTEQLEAATAENAKLQSETSRNDDEIALLKKQLATCTEQNAHLHDELKESKLRFVKLYNKLCCQIRTDEPEADQLIEESDAAVAASSSESNSRSADDAVQSQSAGLRNIEQDIIYLSDDDDDYVPSVKSSNRKASENYEIGKLDVFDLVEKAKLIIKRLRLRHIDLAKQLGLPRQLLSSLLQQPQKLSSLSKARLSGYQKLQVWCVKNDKRSSIG